jgi:hypothetical protein
LTASGAEFSVGGISRISRGTATPENAAVRRLPVLLLSALLAACAAVTPNQAPPATRESPPLLEALPAEVQVARSPFVEPPGVLSTGVEQSNIETTICVSGWTKTVRPPVSYTQRLKRKMLEWAGLDQSEALKYELDHFVPLSLDGHPTSVDNLWLQRWDGPSGARVKDRLERALQVAVCHGRLTLSAAREAIQRGWKEAYRRFVGTPREEPDEEEVVE